MAHGNVHTSSILVTKSGEWKLWGFELVCQPNDDSASIFSSAHMLHHRYLSPEQEKAPGFPNPLHSLDMWAFACVIYQIFNKTAVTSSFSVKGSIPDRLFPLLRNCTQNNPRMRTDFIKFLGQAMVPNGYFDDPLILTSIFLENYSIKEKDEKDQFFA
jgi:SCY1-like protein 1